MATPLDRADISAARAPSSDRDRGALFSFARPALAAILAACEILVISYLFSFEADIPFWLHPVYWLRHLQLLLVASAVAWCLIAWPRRSEITELWARHDTARGWHLPLAANLALFIPLAFATTAFTLHAAAAPTPPWELFWLYCIPLAATGLSMVWLFAPVGLWLDLLRHQRIEILLALTAGVMLLLLSGLARSGWEAMAGLTLTLAYHLLGLYESGVHVDFAARSLGVGDFAVLIDQSCSGYEGMALVTTFLALFLWTFRATLRFPHALLLLPLGIAAIFALNIVRIAALVSLGAHVSPAVAADGFHSQAGWMAFLLVTIGMMVLAPRLSFFSRTQVVRQPTTDRGDRLLMACLVPFMALMAGSILASASAPYDAWMYVIKIAAAGVALLAFRDVYRDWIERVSMVAVAAGLVVGIVWVATAPAGPANPGSVNIAQWLSLQPTGLAALWLAIRAVGGIVIVPVVEELAFRGLLYRWIIARQFENVPFNRLSLAALAISSLLFGLMHQRWIAGMGAGVVFALLMVRSGRLSDAIWAHVAANAVVIGWAIATRQWSQL